LQKQPLSEKNQVESHEEKQGRRNHLTKFVQQHRADPGPSARVGRFERVCCHLNPVPDQKLILVPASRYLPLTSHARARGFRPGSSLTARSPWELSLRLSRPTKTDMTHAVINRLRKTCGGLVSAAAGYTPHGSSAKAVSLQVYAGSAVAPLEVSADTRLHCCLNPSFRRMR
jgi:hypothetical protein